MKGIFQENSLVSTVLNFFKPYFHSKKVMCMITFGNEKLFMCVPAEMIKI